MRARAAIVSLWLAGALAHADTLTVTIEHTFRGAPLRTDELSLRREKNDEPLSITRLAYLVTEFALLQPDGRALRCDGQAAYLNPTEGRISFVLPNVPPGEYAGVAFRIGVPAEWNHREPSAWPAGHALNPSVNHLHWGWQGGFVFLALEGRYGQAGGYSYHLARDPNLATVRLPGAWRSAGDTELLLQFEVARLFPAGGITDANGANTTHSADGDAVAVQLRRSLPGAFELRQAAGRTADGALTVTSSAPAPPQTTPFALPIPAGYPQPLLPADNPLTREGIALGERLFHEVRFSRSGAQSCASCHQPTRGFAGPERVSIGAEGQSGTRNAPALFNLAWHREFAWDGRGASLRAQILAPFADPREFHQPVGEAAGRIADDYRADFAQAFGAPEVTPDRIARALEQYLLSLVSGGHSKFDRAGRGELELSETEKRGFELFQMEYDPARGRVGADCFHCHGGPLFSDYAFHDTGLDPGPASDPGREAATRKPGDRAKFKTPSLRNLARTGPYMHDGRFATLEEVVAHYDHGVRPTPNLDPNLAKHPRAGLGLSPEDQQALVAFLGTLQEPQGESSLPPLR